MIILRGTPAKFRVFGAPQEQSFYAFPALGANGDNANYELGLRFRASVPGLITAIRYWKAAADNSTHIGKIWSDSGTLLTSVTFTGESSSGWQIQSLITPFLLSANTFYRVSVNCVNGYAFTTQGFATSVSSSNLTAPIAAGVFRSGSGNFPDQTFNNNNYYRDLVFVAS